MGKLKKMVLTTMLACTDDQHEWRSSVCFLTSHGLMMMIMHLQLYGNYSAVLQQTC